MFAAQAAWVKFGSLLLVTLEALQKGLVYK